MSIQIGQKYPTGCGGEGEVIAIRPELGEAPVVMIVRFPDNTARIHQYRMDGSYYGSVHEDASKYLPWPRGNAA